MSSEYEEFMNSQKKVSNDSIGTNKNKVSNSEIIRRPKSAENLYT